MRRIALTLALLAAARRGRPSTVAGADDSRTYQVELFNAFGLVKGSELRVAGVKAGTVTDLDITAAEDGAGHLRGGPEVPRVQGRRELLLGAAVADRRVLPRLPARQRRLSRSSGPIPAARNKTTVQPDLVQNTLREPFKDRLQLLINEFGTALDGNAENLNAAIRAGAPALQQLKQVLNILGRQNTTIAELNTNADAIFAAAHQPPRGRRPLHRQRRPDRRDLGRALATTSRRTSTCSTTSSSELQPTMFQLGKLADEQTPLLDRPARGRARAQQAGAEPAALQQRRPAVADLARRRRPGRQGRARQEPGRDRRARPGRAPRPTPPPTRSPSSSSRSTTRSNAVEEDACARYDLRRAAGRGGPPGPALDQKLGVDPPRRPDRHRASGGTAPAGTNPSGGNPGYTGMEGLLNYAYVQTNSLNLFDKLGPRARHHPGRRTGRQRARAATRPARTLPAKGGGSTTQTRRTSPSAPGSSATSQPGINYGANRSGLFGNLRRYDASRLPRRQHRPADLRPDDHDTHAALTAPSAPSAQPTQQRQPAQPQTPQQQKQQKQLDKLLDDRQEPGQGHRTTRSRSSRTC